MVLSHVKFDFRGKCLIEKIAIQAPFRFTAQFQDEACFVYFSAGKTKINSPVEQARIAAKESVLLKCGTYFADLLEYSKAERYEILVFHLYPDLLRKVYADDIPAFINPTGNRPFIQNIVPAEIIGKFVESLYFYFDHPQLASEGILQLKIKELILLLIQTNNASSIANLFADLFTPRTISVKDVVNSHLYSGLSLSDLASLCNLSLSTFNRTFFKIFNDTPANYIKKERLEKAKELLSISSLSISEIAFKTCFNDVAHFSKSFKSAYKFSPSSFRKSLNKKN